MDELVVEVVLQDPKATIPCYVHGDDAGADLTTVEDVVLAPGERKVVGTGVCLAIPAGYAGFVHPRSGLAARNGLSIVNSPGTIDAGYRGEIRVCLINLDPQQPITLSAGDRIAQLIIQRVEHVQFAHVDFLNETSRGQTGYGASGGVGAWRRLDSSQEG